MMPRCPVSAAQRARVLALLDVSFSIKRVEEITSLSRSTILAIKARAKERGYNPDENHAFEDAWFEERPRAGRPLVAGPEQTKVILD